MNRVYSLTILRVVSLIQVFLLHYFAAIGLREYLWIFSIAVPAFLLVSGYLNGLKGEEKLGKKFLLRRFKSLAMVYYPFLIAVFVFYIIYDPENIRTYVTSLLGSMLFLPNLVTPLPLCGHLWFMQVLFFCYIALVLASHLPFLKRWFRSILGSVLMIGAVIGLGFIYRGVEFVYIFFYLWVYYNADRIKSSISPLQVGVVLFLFSLGYLFLAVHYEDRFALGVYLRFIHVSVLAILLIKIFLSLFGGVKDIPIVTWLDGISMEFYLIHHLFVFDYPIYISVPVTIVLSVLLRFVSLALNKLFSNTSKNKPAALM